VSQRGRGGLSHVDESGRARMVDVGEKQVTRRVAVARGAVHMQPATARLVSSGAIEKGDVVATARLAGIMAAKRTSELIPLCHPLPLDFVDVRLDVDTGTGVVTVEAEARCEARTGVEMEALTAVTVAALTIYDMCKAVDRAMTIEGVALERKSGGRSGDYVRPSRTGERPA
jgi:cyclic pyranopterin phosphate synthase